MKEYKHADRIEGETEKPIDPAMQKMIEALVEGTRRQLEYDVALYGAKRRQGNPFTLSYFRGKLYKAILALREYNAQFPKPEWEREEAKKKN